MFSLSAFTYQLVLVSSLTCMYFNPPLPFNDRSVSPDRLWWCCPPSPHLLLRSRHWNSPDIDYHRSDLPTDTTLNIPHHQGPQWGPPRLILTLINHPGTAMNMNLVRALLEKIISIGKNSSVEFISANLLEYLTVYFVLPCSCWNIILILSIPTDICYLALEASILMKLFI